MPNPLLYCATDKELFDVLMSSKQHFGEGALLHLALTRGIILSPLDDRTELADRLSCMIFSFEDIQAIQAEFERAGRGEKTTSFRLNTALTTDDIKAIAEDYRESVGEQEKITSYAVGTNGFAVDVKYTETDFSKTRLRQRQTKEAHVEFRVEGDHTIVTLPATDKARMTAEALRDRLYALKKADINAEEVDLSAVRSATLRTLFFTKLISGLSGFTLQNVTRVKVSLAENLTPVENSDEENDDEKEASEEMLGVVKAAALHGQSLLSSPEYQALSKRGFFITDITWSSQKKSVPLPIVEFDAGFDDRSSGRQFKFGVRGWATQKANGDYTKSFRPMPEVEKKASLAILEEAAIRVFRDIRERWKLSNADDSSGDIV